MLRCIMPHIQHSAGHSKTICAQQLDFLPDLVHCKFVKQKSNYLEAVEEMHCQYIEYEVGKKNWWHSIKIFCMGDIVYILVH